MSLNNLLSIEFVATESGFEAGVGGASNAAGTADYHYVLFGRQTDAQHPECTGVYFDNSILPFSANQKGSLQRGSRRGMVSSRQSIGGKVGSMAIAAKYFCFFTSPPLM